MRGRVRLYLVVCASIVMGAGGFSPGAFLDFVPPALGCPAAVTTTPSISGVFNSSDLAGSTADKAETRILLELATEYEEQADQASAGQMDAPR
jgi:hypothetical protein